MLGLVHPCSTHLAPELRERWRAHLCGLCLTVRDTAGQPARAVTNTDAVFLSVLVEAQQEVDAATRTAGPCPLRGMRRAEVITSGELSVRLGSTAALTLAAAKVGDRAAEVQAGLTGPGGGGPTARRTVGLLRLAERRLTVRALADREVLAAVGVPGALAGLAEQAEIEARASTLSQVTEPTSRAVGEMFAASAALAGRDENVGPLMRVGRAYGEFAHLADALEDLDEDRARGAYNPLDATATTRAQAVARLRELREAVLTGLHEVRLRDDRLVRPLLVAAMGTVLAANKVSLTKGAKSGTKGAVAGQGAGRRKRKDTGRGIDLTERPCCCDMDCDCDCD